MDQSPLHRGNMLEYALFEGGPSVPTHCHWSPPSCEAADAHGPILEQEDSSRVLFRS